jgi:hypothetical protein
MRRFITNCVSQKLPCVGWVQFAAGLNLSQPYGPPRPGTGISLLYLLYYKPAVYILSCAELIIHKAKLIFYIFFETYSQVPSYEGYP